MRVHTIQVNVPICPSCGGSLKHNQIMQKYLCHHCGTRFKVIGFGQSERELICEEEIRAIGGSEYGIYEK